MIFASRIERARKFATRLSSCRARRSPLLGRRCPYPSDRLHIRPANPVSGATGSSSRLSSSVCGSASSLRDGSFRFRTNRFRLRRDYSRFPLSVSVSQSALFVSGPAAPLCRPWFPDPAADLRFFNDSPRIQTSVPVSDVAISVSGFQGPCPRRELPVPARRLPFPAGSFRIPPPIFVSCLTASAS